jgi:hypothetical protein
MRRSGFIIAVAAPLAVAVMTAGPVRATTDCNPTEGVFSPGRWRSDSLEMSGTVRDDISTLVTYGSGSFALTINEYGEASGGLSIEGVAGAVSNSELNQDSMTAQYTVDATLEGTGSRVFAQGEMTTQMSGSIDVRGADGYSFLEEEEGTKEDFAFGNTFTVPWSTTISPTASNCNQAYGTFGGSLLHGDDGMVNQFTDDVQTIWYAFKSGKSQEVHDIESEFVELMDDAERILNMDPIDTDVLAQFIKDVLSFDSLLASAEYCDKVDLGGLAPGNPAYYMLRSVMFNVMYTFLNAADKGAYETQDVITLATMFLQSASLGWRGPSGDCLEPNVNEDAALDIFTRVEDVLIERYRQAVEAGDQKDIDAIVAAAYHFMMPRLLEEVNGQ